MNMINIPEVAEKEQGKFTKFLISYFHGYKWQIAYCSGSAAFFIYGAFFSGSTGLEKIFPARLEDIMTALSRGGTNGFICAFAPLGILILSLCLLGFGLIFSVISPLFPAVCGLVGGNALTNYYSCSGNDGLLLGLCGIAPLVCIYITAVSLTTAECARFSSGMFVSLFIRQSGEGTRGELCLYLTRILCYLALSAVLCTVSSVIIKIITA